MWRFDCAADNSLDRINELIPNSAAVHVLSLIYCRLDQGFKGRSLQNYSCLEPRLTREMGWMPVDLSVASHQDLNPGKIY